MAVGLEEVVRNQLCGEFLDGALLCADRGDEVAEMVDGQGNVGTQRLPHGFAVLPGFQDGDLLEVSLEAVGDCVEYDGAVGGAGGGPGREGSLGSCHREIDVCHGGPREFGNWEAGARSTA